MSNKAQEILIPQTEGIFRTVFLYTGQGESTLMIIPSDNKYKYILIDSNVDKTNEGINLKLLLKDLMGNSPIDVFINTHPHNDHLNGIKEIYDEVGIDEVWHSGHIPSKKHKGAYEELEYVMKEVGDDNVYLLLGSNEENKLDGNDHPLGDIIYNVLSPAEYVSDEIEDEDDDTRYQRIHEQSGVIRFSYGNDPGRILITGDSDLCAWKDHITEYHKDRIPSNVLSASHHGSRTFFKENEDDEPYLDHIDEIEPTYVIISAPKQNESQFDHPHDDAIDLYKKYVDEDNLLHLGDYNNSRVCVIIDIDSEGNLDVQIDTELWDKYKYTDDDNNDENKETLASSIIAARGRNEPPSTRTGFGIRYE